MSKYTKTVISLSDGNNIRSNRGSSEWELIIVNSMDNSFSLTSARASDRIATKERGSGMSENEFLYQMRLKIFQEADKKEIPIVLLCKKHHLSRRWFYKWKKRRERLGDEGLRSKDKSSFQDAQ